MSHVAEQAELGIQRLRTAYTKGNDVEIDRATTVVEQTLLHKENYRQIGDERLLIEALDLLSQVYGEEVQDRLEGLRQHRQVMGVIHDKFFAILNPDVGLEDLLYLHLSEWPVLEEPIMCRFSGKTKRQLHDIRCNNRSLATIEEFTELFLQTLGDEGLDDVVSVLTPYLDLGLEGYKRNAQQTVHALFASGRKGEVRGIRMVATRGAGNIAALDTIDLDMQKAASHAMQCATSLWAPVKGYDVTWEIRRDDIAFGGDSIGLALSMGILAATTNLDIDPYTAFTGHVEWDTGEVKQVGNLDAKLEAAAQGGIRRVFLPQANLVTSNTEKFDLKFLPVNSVKETQGYLNQRGFDYDNGPLERLAEAKIREMEIELKGLGIQKQSQTQRESYWKRLVFTDWRNEVPVDVYHSKKLKVLVQGKDCPLKAMVQQVADQVFGQEVPRSSEPEPGKKLGDKYSVSAPGLQQKIRERVLSRPDAIEEQEQNCLYRAKIAGRGQTVFVRQFTSGTLTVRGPNPLFDEVNREVQALLGADASPVTNASDDRKRTQIEAVEAVELGDQWIGTDESGKGDYFGPLVGAAVLVDTRTATILHELGVSDSKKLSDKRNRELAQQIREVCGKRAKVVVIPPERYNQLYAQFRNEGKNLNTLLAWAHTRALEDILPDSPQDGITVLIDKFADESYIHGKLLEKGRSTNLNLVQLPKAEVNVAVAAASILARAQFLEWLARLSRQYAVDFPKGASDPQIIEVGKLILQKHGRNELAKVAKLHFRTTGRILEEK